MTQFKVMLLIGVLLMCQVCWCQLTFTPSWGKRDLAGGAASLGSGAAAQMVGGGSIYGGGSETNCKTSMDSMLMIYRLIQTEAQRVVACNGK